jgi:predicted PurR-regulated permease PerM
MEPKRIEISYRTVVFSLGLVAGLGLLYSLRQIVVYVLVAVVLMTALSPTVDKLENLEIAGKRRLPRPVAILVIYILGLVGFSLVIASVVQPLVTQTSLLISRLPVILSDLGIPDIDERVITSQLTQLGSLPGNAVRLVSGVFSNLVGLFTILAMAFYLVLEREDLHKHLTKLLGNEDLEKRIDRVLDRMEQRMGGWVRGELFLMTIVGVMTYVGLAILGIPFAVPLALVSGLLEILPNVGPVVATIPGAILGFTVSPVHALAAVAWYFVVQQLENHLIVPQVMAKSAGVNPLVTIVAVLAGFELGGVLGAILAVPVVLMGFTVWEEVGR